MKQVIPFCRSADGVRIAYAESGQGPPLIKAANYLTHLEHDWNSPVWHHWLQGLSQTHRLIRYDARGSGLSDWDVDTYSITAWVQDLEAVFKALDVDRAPLLGISQGAAVCIAFAAKHPQRVSRMVLYGGYARGRFRRDLSRQERLEAESLINLIEVGWGKSNPAFRQLFTTMMIPEADEAQRASMNELTAISATPENAARMERAFYEIDVRREAELVRAPVLVLHAREDATIPLEEGRLLTALIPDARFVLLESKNHILLEGEGAWARFRAEMRSFLGAGPAEIARADDVEPFPELTKRERETLEVIAQGLDNRQIAERLVISPKTVRNNASRIYSKLEARSRVQAVVLAREAGMGRSGTEAAER